jgi:predicted GNAT superfamily acetyltransferase
LAINQKAGERMFEIKRLVDIEDIKSIQSIEQQVWQSNPTPVHQTYTSSKNGGFVLGGYIDNKLAGFQYSFPGYKDGKTYLCSHMLGILPDYQKSGLGKELKLAQKQLALELGYSLIVWTYDPLESVNAYLNLHKLKGIGATYLENYYGSMDDTLNHGLPSDRFLVEWWIQSSYLQSEHAPHYDIPNDSSVKTTLNSKGFPVIIKENFLNKNNDYLFFPIPDHIQEIKKQDPELAFEWRIITRKWFQESLREGYSAVDLIRSPGEKLSYYVFKKTPIKEMEV